MRTRAVLVVLLAAALCWGAPLIGLLAAGVPLVGYLQFPPRGIEVAHASFAWSVFLPLCLPPLGVVTLYCIALARARPSQMHRSAAHFPWWGWVGLTLTGSSWALAWGAGAVPAMWRRHSFTPLWLGFVVTMNALAYQRSGRSPLTHRTHWFLLLFPVSAGFWWLFEYLNQFVGNWYYAGIGSVGTWEYFLRATLPFSTVLPAVASAWAWLRGFPRLDALALPPLHGHRTLAAIALLIGGCALGGIGIWPQALFPLLWIAPLLLLAGLEQLLLGETLFSALRRGDWRPVLQPALAALLCGFFWEMWNYGSLAQWRYSIPYVQRFHLFAMPALGYAGYLPFGIECALLMDLVARFAERRSLWIGEYGQHASRAAVT